MRYYTLNKNKYHNPIVNLDKIWSLVGEEVSVCWCCVCVALCVCQCLSLSAVSLAACMSQAAAAPGGQSCGVVWVGARLLLTTHASRRASAHVSAWQLPCTH